jgi:hypothetical protein
MQLNYILEEFYGKSFISFMYMGVGFLTPLRVDANFSGIEFASAIHI